MIKVTVEKDGKPVTQYMQQELDKEIPIGRAPGCAIRLDEEAVSRLHAVIRHTQAGWIIEKKAAQGVVSVNGNEIEDAVLTGGEAIHIGSYILHVESGGETKTGISRNTNAPEEESDKTSFIGASSAIALFRFEPGSANMAEFVMDKDLAVFGRASNCDVVLSEKRASRKHVEIRRMGLSFFLKDLNSANGTKVNGKAVTEAELVPGDVIEVGECRFQFSVENKEFFTQQGEFLPVPSHLAEEAQAADMQEVAPIDPSQPQEWDPNAPYQFSGTGEPVAGAPDFGVTENKAGIAGLWEKYKALPTVRRYLIILLVFAFATALLSEEEKTPQKKTNPNAKPTLQLGTDGKPLRIFDNLSQNDKNFILKAYKDLLAAQEKTDYPKVLENASKILNYVDDYNQTKSLESLARKAIDEQEQKERAKKQQERLEKIRQEVLVLEETGKEIYAKALKDSKYREDLNKVIQDIYSKDPNNRVAQEWTTGLKEAEEEEKRKKELAILREEKRKKAEAAYEEVEKIFEKNRYVDALAAAEKLKDVDWDEKSYRERIANLKQQIREKLSSTIDPLLQEAVTQSKEGGDLVKSKNLYLNVLKWDPQNPTALGGLSDIREVLHSRAKRLYTEAILAESLSDLGEAKEKFDKCLLTAPEEDPYKQKCKDKLLKFEGFKREAEQ